MAALIRRLSDLRTPLVGSICLILVLAGVVLVFTDPERETMATFLIGTGIGLLVNPRGHGRATDQGPR